MRNSFLRRVVLAAAVVCLSGVTAMAYEGNAPLQAFIDREKSQQDFKVVGGLWAPDKNFDASRTTQYVKEAQYFTLNFNDLTLFMGEKNRCIDLVLPNPKGGSFTVKLSRYDFTSSGFKLATDANGKETPLEYAPGLHYRGVVDGMPGSIAAFSFFDNEVSGIFSIPHVGNYVMIANSVANTESAGNPSYVLYNDMDLNITPEGPVCSAEMLPGYLDPIKDQIDAQSKNTFNNCKEVQVYVRTDYQCYVSKQSNTTNVTNQVTAIFNIVSAVYRNEGIYLALKALIMNTTSDVYQGLAQSSGDFLTEFGYQTQSAMQGADLAVLFSTRYGASMGGIAWLDVLCAGYNSQQSSGPYAFVNISNSTPSSAFQYSWNTSATSHELGHNFGSRHTHWCGWTGGAIDGCYTLEGSCAMPNPQYPTADGTIMSYCHLVSGVGVNFANGFGPLPGNKIRTELNGANCAHSYAPNVPVTAANVTTNANRECTDPNGITYYWNDGANADTLQDKIVLRIKKGTNNIGNLDVTGFAVKTVTLAGYGGGTGVSFPLPAGLPAGNNRAMQRYWSMTPTTQPTSAVEVFVPFYSTDITDVDGSVPGAPATINNFAFYNLESAAINADPSAGLTGATSSNMKVLWIGNNSTTTNWKSSPIGTTQYAQYQTTKLVGGAGFINYIHSLSIENTGSGQGISIYPNPFSDNWSIDVPQGDNMTLQVYATDGKVVQSELLQAGKANTINSSTLPTGVYFYRVTGATDTFTGSIVKQ
jgi:hypothetical protein